MTLLRTPLDIHPFPGTKNLFMRYNFKKQVFNVRNMVLTKGTKHEILNTVKTDFRNVHVFI